MNKKGKIIIISGPSGVGKGTICAQILKKKELNLILSVSMTTRKKRHNEVEGENYFFVNNEEFEHNISNNKLLEYTKFVDNYYGTLKEYCENKLNNGKNILLEIEVEGAMQVMKKLPDAISIFIIPPSLSELRKRIKKRNTENAQVVELRIKKAKKEMQLISKYKYLIVNEDISKAVKEITAIIKREINYE